LNGFDAAERLQKQAPGARIVILTANVQESSRARASAMRMQFVPKPITDLCLKQVLAHLTAQP
jgi:CheY-like chemotaxis protein